MAVIGVRETWSDRRADISNEEIHYERVFRVWTNSPLDDALTVMIQSGVPLLRTPYVGPNGIYDLRARCTKVEPRQDQDNPYTWLVRCYYERKRQTGGDKPQLDPPQLSIDTETIQVWQPSDSNNKVYANSAGEYFSPPVMTPETVTVLTVKFAWPTFDVNWPGVYQNTVNALPFFGCAKDTVLLDKFSGETATLQDTLFYYWHITMVFKYRPDTWDLIVPDVGMKELATGPDGNQYLIPITIQGVPVANPYPLDGSGHKAVIPAGQTPDQFIKTIDFKQYPEVDWTPLPWVGGLNVDSWIDQNM